MLIGFVRLRARRTTLGVTGDENVPLVSGNLLASSVEYDDIGNCLLITVLCYKQISGPTNELHCGAVPISFCKESSEAVQDQRPVLVEGPLPRRNTSVGLGYTCSSSK